MKKTALILLISILFLANGCSIFKKSKKAPAINSGYIKTLTLKAMNGEKASNHLLSGLFNLNIPVLNRYNKLMIDSLRENNRKKYYCVLLTFPNPVYNRFAIYDTTLRAYLIDKSLNGYVNYNNVNLPGKRLIELTENFKTKDILELQRVSLYQISNTKANLVFRSFTGLKTPRDNYTQTINEIDTDRIKTSLESKKRSLIKDKADVFDYNDSLKKYISVNNVFNKFVIKRIEIFKHKSELPEIKDEKSALASVGLNPSIDSNINVKDAQGYSIMLTGNWNTLRNFNMDDYFKKKFKGTRYINEKLGASISVIMIPSFDSAEVFIKYKLPYVTKEKYRVRYSDKILLRKDFLQFYEFSCGAKKYVLVLRASKYTYEQYKNLYQNIINSFTINC